VKGTGLRKLHRKQPVM